MTLCVISGRGGGVAIRNWVFGRTHKDCRDALSLGISENLVVTCWRLEGFIAV